MLYSGIVFGNDTYPITYKFIDLLEGGKMIRADNGGNSKLYYVKPSIEGETESLSIWDNIERKNMRGLTLNDVKIQYSFPYRNNLLFVSEENQKYYLSMMDSNANVVALSEIINFTKDPINNRYSWVRINHTNEILLLMNENLYKCQIEEKSIRIDFINSKVKAITGFLGKYENKYAFLSEFGNSTEVYFADKSGKEKLAARIQLSSNLLTYAINDKIAVISFTKGANSSWLYIVDAQKGVVFQKLISSNGKFIKCFSKDNNNYFAYLTYGENYYSLNIFEFDGNELRLNSSISLPLEMIGLKELCVNGNYIYMIFSNGLSKYNLNEGLLSVDYYPIDEYMEDDIEVIEIDNYLVLTAEYTTMIFKMTENRFWWFNRFLKNFGQVTVPVFLILIILILYKKYRSQRRLLEAIIDLPSSGVVFVLDKRSRLRKANDSGKAMLKITNDVPMKRLFQYYCEPQRTKSLKELVDKVMNVRETFTQKIDIIDDNRVKEWYFSSILLRGLTGKFKGCVLIGYDITEQLERKRMTNWAQLAHDMQTNLSTIRLNAEQLDCQEKETNLRRREKILHQVNLLMNRIRDIVTVGRSTAPELEYINSADICVEAVSEFDEVMFPYVSFELNLKDFNLYCDKAKMIRALRNLIENGIRALKEQEGKIIISNWNDNKFAYFSVRDNGVGMDESQLMKMNTPYFSTSQKEGGAGIGTMIIQNVVEQHGGSLKVDSEPGKGTEVIISIPLLNKK